jgi:hypothetical protein
MDQDGTGKGKLVLTGQAEPALEVSYDISHDVCVREGPNGEPVQWKKASVHRLNREDGQDIPLGDFDLLVGAQLLRLKHLASDPAWLVLSSNG